MAKTTAANQEDRMFEASGEIEEEKDIGALLDAALKEARLSQYAVADRLAGLRSCAECYGSGEVDVGTTRKKIVVCPSCKGTGLSKLGSQDQQLRRIRRLGQIPTEDYARDLARAFAPELDLPEDYFFAPRSTNANLRESVSELQQRVAALEKLLAEEGNSPKRPKAKKPR